MRSANLHQSAGDSEAQPGSPALSRAVILSTKQHLFSGGNSGLEATHQWTLTFLLWEIEQSPASTICAALRSTINMQK